RSGRVRYRDAGVRLPPAVEPDPGRKSMAGGPRVCRTGGVHPHLPGTGTRLRRRHHWTGPDVCRNRRQDRATRAFEARPLHPWLPRKVEEGSEHARARRSHRTQHLPDLADSRNEGLLRVLLRPRARGLSPPPDQGFRLLVELIVLLRASLGLLHWIALGVELDL